MSLSPVMAAFFGTKMMVECLRQEETSHTSNDVLKLWELDGLLCWRGSADLAKLRPDRWIKFAFLLGFSELLLCSRSDLSLSVSLTAVIVAVCAGRFSLHTPEVTQTNE